MTREAVGWVPQRSGRKAATAAAPSPGPKDTATLAFTTVGSVAIGGKIVLTLPGSVATTLGYGPRFLHSTGQLHKGGAAIGCFIQLTNGHPVDIEIPGRTESFGVLVDAQAMGDFAAFGAHDLPALRIDLGDDPEAGLNELLAAFAEALS